MTISKFRKNAPKLVQHAYLEFCLNSAPLDFAATRPTRLPLIHILSLLLLSSLLFHPVILSVKSSWICGTANQELKMTFEKSSRNTLLVGQTWIITTMSWPYYNNNATRSRSSSIHYFNYEFSPPLGSSSFFSFATFQTLMTLQFWPTFGFLQPIDVSHRHRHAQGSTFDTLFENLQYVKIVKNASHFLKFAFAFQQAKIFGGFLKPLSRHWFWRNHWSTTTVLDLWKVNFSLLSLFFEVIETCT